MKLCLLHLQVADDVVVKSEPEDSEEEWIPHIDGSDWHLSTFLLQKNTGKLSADRNDTDAENVMCNLCELEVTNSTHILDRHRQLSGHYICHRCLAPYKTLPGLDNHIQSLCHLDRNWTPPKPQSAEEKQYLCPRCGKISNTRVSFHVHTFSCKNERNFKCSECGVGFNIKSSLKRHFRTLHSDEKPYLCKLCAKRYKTKRGVAQHESTHTTNLPFKCESCPRSFRERWNYLQHRRIHTGELPYECKICGERFRYNVSMKAHRRKHAEFKDTD